MSYSTQFLHKSLNVIIDRPMGTKHPDKDFFYPVNYGYIKGIKAPDGEDLDAYVLGVFEPVHEFEGTCIAVIHRTDVEDDKLVVVPKNKDYTDAEIKILTEFQERFYESHIIR